MSDHYLEDIQYLNLISYEECFDFWRSIKIWFCYDSYNSGLSDDLKIFLRIKICAQLSQKAEKTWLNANQRKHYQTFYIKCSWKGHKSQNSFCESDSGPHPTMFFKNVGKKASLFCMNLIFMKNILEIIRKIHKDYDFRPTYFSNFQK